MLWSALLYCCNSKALIRKIKQIAQYYTNNYLHYIRIK